ncbi:hypothetical protein B0H16DRAFT_1762086, partial [Mycena metata]
QQTLRCCSFCHTNLSRVLQVQLSSACPPSCFCSLLSSMASSVAKHIAFSGLNIEYSNSAFVVQSFFFGIYSVLVVLSTRIRLRRGVKTRMDHLLFFGPLLMYTLSTAYWLYSVALSADRIRNFVKDVNSGADYSSDHTPVAKWDPLFNSLVLVNYVCSDAVVVWRAWIIASTESRNYRRFLYIACFFLVLTFFIGVIEFPVHPVPKSSYLTYGTNVLQTMNLTFSLISNLIATAIVAAITFRHRKLCSASFATDNSTKSGRILTLLVESGVLYCMTMVTTMVSGLIRIPAGTLGDLLTPVNIQIAGAYPSIVLLLGSRQHSLNKTTILNLSKIDGIELGVRPEGTMA